MIGARNIRIEIDGGVTPETAPLVVSAGADVLVAGSAVFKGGPSAYAANIAAIRSSLDAAGGAASTGAHAIFRRPIEPSPISRRTA